MTIDDSDPLSALGDMAALAMLWQDHRAKLLAMIQRRNTLLSRLDAEDVLSEAFLEARRRWPRFKSDSPLTPYAWLYRVTFDTLIEAFRRHNRSCRSPEREMIWPEHSSVQLGLGLESKGCDEKQQRRAACTLRLLGVKIVVPNDSIARSGRWAHGT